MQSNVEPDFQSQLDAVFAQLNPQAVEEFYAAYQQWSLQQRKNELRQRIEMVRAQQAENEQRLREAQPSAIAFAALARLQSNGVSDIALLDAMLERGESWLDQTMQRLDYFEQFDDFISDDYTKWCQGALEGAFDWIDSLRDGVEQTTPEQVETPPEQSPSNSEEAAEVEALLLQRLATEHEEDDLEWQEAITLKRPAIQPHEPKIATGEPVEQEPPADDAQQHEGILAQAAEYIPQDEQETESRAQAAEYIPQDEPDQYEETTIAPDTASPTSAEEQVLPDEASPVEESALVASEPEQPALIEFASLEAEEIAPHEEASHTGNEEPPLIESAAVDEPSVAGDELNAADEESTLVEFATPASAEVSPVSPPEEAADQETEQGAPSETSQVEETSAEETGPAAPSEVPASEDVPAYEETLHDETNEPDEAEEMEQGAPEDVLTHEETLHTEVDEPGEQNEPQEMEQSAPTEPAPHEEETLPVSQANQPVRGTPRKAGLMRRLARFFAGS